MTLTEFCKSPAMKPFEKAFAQKMKAMPTDQKEFWTSKASLWDWVEQYDANSV